MSEETSMSIQHALDAVDKATGFAEPLRRRTEGMTIAWWGLITAGIILTSGILDDLHGFMHAGGWRQVVSMLAWIPWTVLGIVGTLGIWRIAETANRSASAGRRRSWRMYAGWAAAMVVLLLLLTLAIPVAQAGMAVAAVGFIWLAIGLFDLYQATPQGRRTILVVGAIVVASGVVFGAFTATDNDLAWSMYTVIGTLTGGLVPVIAGLLQTMRG